MTKPAEGIHFFLILFLLISLGKQFSELKDARVLLVTLDPYNQKQS